MPMSFSIRPEQHELIEARKEVEKVLESCKYTLEKNEGLSVDLGYTDSSNDYGAFGRVSSGESAEIFFDASVEGWKNDLKEVAADVYGRSYFYENSEINFKWQQLLASVTGLMVIEEVSDGREIEVEELREEWAEKKTDLSEEYLGEEMALSWQLKLAVGRKLLEEYELEDLPELKRTDVLEAGDALFKDEA